VTEDPGAPGKEVVLRFIHRAPRCAERPFIALNCAVLPEQWLDPSCSAMSAAPSGAHAARAGKVEQASGGMLFLDEVAEMSSPVQAGSCRSASSRSRLRLGLFEIVLPPLRERPEDILVLAEAFLDEIGRGVGRVRPPACRKTRVTGSWARGVTAAVYEGTTAVWSAREYLAEE
jgi:DNA-binding NtrC family response regulator